MRFLSRPPFGPSRPSLRHALPALPLALALAFVAMESRSGAEGPVQNVTYAGDVAGILSRHCQECHRPGEAVPMTFMNYQEVRSWAKSIKKVIQAGQMPPWHAREGVGDWRNERRLTKEEKDKLMAWADAGAPLGDPLDLPPQKKFSPGWKIGEPDATFSAPKAEQIGADMIDGYRYVTIKTNFTEDRWLKAVECKPGNYEVVHHIIAFCKTAGGKGGGSVLGAAGVSLVGSYAPGMNPYQFEDGTAILLPAGAEIVFQMHYHNETGQAHTDRSSIGMKFADFVVQKQYQADFSGSVLLAIPPNAENHRVEGVWTAKRDTELHTILPHMHLRGKAMRVWAKYPDGNTEDLLDVPAYDFNWQTIYEYKEPKLLPKGTKIYSEAFFDNSANNPWNPDPNRTVTFGEDTNSEMMFAFLGFTWADDALNSVDPDAKYLKAAK